MDIRTAMHSGVVAPDQRGCGRRHGRVVASSGETSAVIVGHDLGAWVAQAAAMPGSDLFRGLVKLNAPAPPRGKVKPSDGWRAMAQDKIFYHLYFLSGVRPERQIGPVAGGARGQFDLAHLWQVRQPLKAGHFAAAQWPQEPRK